MLMEEVLATSSLGCADTDMDRKMTAGERCELQWKVGVEEGRNDDIQEPLLQEGGSE